MKKKIIVPTLTVVWIMAFVIIGYLSSVVYQMQLDEMISEPYYHKLVQQVIIDITAVSLGVSCILYMTLSYVIKGVSDPIKEMTDEAKKFGKENYKHTLRHYDMEELEELGMAFDAMGERLHRTIRKLEYQKTKAESMLLQLEEGIIILDEEGYVSEYNSFAKDFLGLQEIGKKCWIKSLLREPNCETMLEEAFNKKESASCEVEKDDKILHLRTTVMGKEQDDYGYIVSIRDITKTRRLEGMRYQFVTNVTHELKTPLTSIQGFVETLQGGAIENKEVAKRFLNIIDIEAKRLYRLIQDILLLSEIEHMDEIEGNRVKVAEVIEEVKILLDKEAAQKYITLKVDIQEAIILQRTHYDHLKQVIMNLVSNSIKYTDEGEVCISLKKENGRQVLYISDTGIGIDMKHLPHIFERFYRVDKSRSRQTGGTGLGLSIVKHIVQLYKWDIEVESELKKGSTFKIIF